MAVEESTPATRISVALIDSDTEVRRAVQLRLGAGLFDVRAYASGMALLAEDGPRPDCVVMRDTMGEIDGFELLRRLRDRGWHGPAILLTNTPSLELAETAAGAGFATVIDRPLVDDVMLDAVGAATRTRPEIVA